VTSDTIKFQWRLPEPVLPAPPHAHSPNSADAGAFQPAEHDGDAGDGTGHNFARRHRSRRRCDLAKVRRPATAASGATSWAISPRLCSVSGAPVGYQTPPVSGASAPLYLDLLKANVGSEGRSGKECKRSGDYGYETQRQFLSTRVANLGADRTSARSGGGVHAQSIALLSLSSPTGGR
jgi:hypothetical protein